MESERLEFVRLAAGGEISMSELCRRFGVSRPTGYLWMLRYRAEGAEGLRDRPRRPRSHPGRTSDEVEELVCGVRRSHPAWGGRKIRGFLLRQGHQGIPAASTITQILRRRGLVDPTPAPARDYQRFEAPFPNALWQMDFKGYLTLTNGKRCHPFGVLDDHSRFNVTLAASGNQRTATVKALLSTAFGRYGLPDRILCDNGSPWGNTWDQPWTPLGVWLCDLGIEVSHGRPYHPQTQGKEERFHRTLDLEVLSTRPRWASSVELQGAFDDFRVLYNHHRPHSALGETLVPADRYRPSERAFPDAVPPVHYPDGTEVRKVDVSARISFRGQEIRVGKPFRGKRIGVRPSATDGVYTLYYRHQPIRTVDLREPADV